MYAHVMVKKTHSCTSPRIEALLLAARQRDQLDKVLLLAAMPSVLSAARNRRVRVAAQIAAREASYSCREPPTVTC